MASHLHKMLLRNTFRYVPLNRALCTTSALKNVKIPEHMIPKNLLDEFYNLNEQGKGKIYDKRPFKVKLEANKKYMYCTCGESKSQPFCDGTHKIISFKINLKPIPVKVAETKDYWLCNCKQSEHRPFCDGTHEKPEIEAASKAPKT